MRPMSERPDGLTFEQLSRHYYRYSDEHLRRLIREVVAAHPEVELARVQGNTRVFSRKVVDHLDELVPDDRKLPRGPDAELERALDELCATLERMGLAAVVEGRTVRLLHNRRLSGPLVPEGSSADRVRRLTQNLRTLQQRAKQVGAPLSRDPAGPFQAEIEGTFS